jgi:hypothetical protein
MKKISTYIIWTGLSLLVFGLIYEIMFAGIPYQDPPADIQLRYERNQMIASWTMMLGLATLLAGGVIRTLVSVIQFEK